MPNVTWQEPQILADLLALNLYASVNNLDLPEDRELVIVSPWLSNIDLSLQPGTWYQLLTMGEATDSTGLLDCVRIFREQGWRVQLAVLAYGTTGQLQKPIEKFGAERACLKRAIELGAEVYLVPNLHAKGIVTPLGVITGSTNFTHSGMWLQSQNVNYFAHDHPDNRGNRTQLLTKFSARDRASSIP